MEIQEDFRELLKLLNSQKVKFVIVGGYALAFHGVPRYTGDIDIYIYPDKENSTKIIKAIEEFGFGDIGINIEDFEKQDTVIQIGYPPVRIDLITSLTGVTWEEVFSNSVEGYYADIPVRYIGINELVMNKKALGRKKDLSDIESLDH